ncbi:helix-turn-helix transcriptional regulator [Vibrio coralliilyticus]|uniref:helix-turn-helix domain-containing protein n=1 Tax=Vibrio coralliilyticus TaxID=190893 RepID=UPI00068CFEBA|nr:helix-turn-helix transcriptional regulator [Vibrio coralliilyticus]
MTVSPVRLKQLRAENGWSQEQLAEISGLSYRTIQRAEKDGSCSSESQMALASAFSISPSELLNEYKDSVGSGGLNLGGLLGLALVSGFVGLQFYLPPTDIMFFDLVSVLLVVAITFALSSMSCGLGETVGAFLLLRWFIVEPNKKTHAQRYLPTLRKLIIYSYSAGFVSTFIGLLAVFSVPGLDREALIEGISIACLTMLYAAFMSEFLFRPLKNKISHMLSI